LSNENCPKCGAERHRREARYCSSCGWCLLQRCPTDGCQGRIDIRTAADGDICSLCGKAFAVCVDQKCRILSNQHDTSCQCGNRLALSTRTWEGPFGSISQNPLVAISPDLSSQYGQNGVGQLHIESLTDKIEALVYASQGLFIITVSSLYLLEKTALVKALKAVSSMAKPGSHKLNVVHLAKLPAPLDRQQRTAKLRIRSGHAYVLTVNGLSRLDISSGQSFLLDSDAVDFTVSSDGLLWLTRTGSDWRLKSEKGVDIPVFGEGGRAHFVGGPLGHWIVGEDWHSDHAVAIPQNENGIHVKKTPGTVLRSFSRPDGALSLLVLPSYGEWAVIEVSADGTIKDEHPCLGEPPNGEVYAYFGKDDWMVVIDRRSSGNSEQFGLTKIQVGHGNDYSLFKPMTESGEPLGVVAVEGTIPKIVVPYARQGGKPFGSAAVISIHGNNGPSRDQGDPLGISNESTAGPCCFAEGWLLTARTHSSPNRTTLLKVQNLTCLPS
jgi:hypothetical protein